LRIIHIITRMIVGGAQENTLLSVEGLNRMGGYAVDLVSGVDGGPEGDLLGRAAETCPLTVIPQLYRRINLPDDTITLVKLYQIIRRGRYHIVHTHSSKAGFLGRLAARIASSPVVIHTQHGLVFHPYQPWLVNRIWRATEKICDSLTDHFISVSDNLTKAALAAGIGTPDKYTTVYSGMELDWYLHSTADRKAIRQEFNIPQEAPVVGKIARLFPLKGHEFLFNAAPEIVRRWPEVRFFLVGDGILSDHFKDRARCMGLTKNFVFAGLIQRQRVPELISAMDIVVHTSLREGLARVLPQALAMGKPCVAFDLDGAPEVVIPGKTGFLVKACDSIGLAASISKLIEDRNLQQAMGEAGKKLVDPRFRAETMVSQIADVYQMVLATNKSKVEAAEARWKTK
jgi:glycosyltransferase involved in cell wall biosynthesis